MGHALPKEESARRSWIEIARPDASEEEVDRLMAGGKDLRISTEHFTLDQFNVQGENVMLKKEAVPQFHIHLTKDKIQILGELPSSPPMFLYPPSGSKHGSIDSLIDILCGVSLKAWLVAGKKRFLSPVAEALQLAGSTFTQPAKVQKVRERVVAAKRALDMARQVIPALAVQTLDESTENEKNRERIRELEETVAAQRIELEKAREKMREMDDNDAAIMSWNRFMRNPNTDVGFPIPKPQHRCWLSPPSPPVFSLSQPRTSLTSFLLRSLAERFVQEFDWFQNQGAAARNV